MCAAGATEGANLRVAPLSLFGLIEKGDVFWVGSWPSALDVVNPKGIQLFGNPNLVVYAERDALSLRAIAQGRIIDHDLIRIHRSATDSVSQHGGVCKVFVMYAPISARLAS